jgi:hypothetical protein
LAGKRLIQASGRHWRTSSHTMRPT